MLGNLRKILKQKNTTLDSHNRLDESELPVMTGEDLIKFLNQTNKLRSIKRKVMVDSVRFEKMYQEPIYRFCEIVQLTPASQAHHHSFPGGLIIHTLAVIEYAINERQKYTLPLSSEPHIIEAQKSLWTFAVFAAALCHDIGKTVTMVSFVDNRTQESKSVLAGTLIDHGVSRYHFGWKSTEYYSLHQQIGASFLPKLFDSVCMSYISEELDIFKEMLAYIQGDKYNWGSIGNIVQTADGISTSEALKIATGSRKFRGANLENFGERIMRTLRIILNNKSVPKNRAGAALWVTSHYTYAVAKPFAEMVREEMDNQGATDVPSDNTRIFDELQHQNFCETALDGQAIFKIEITIDEGRFKQVFTCIKLKNKHLYAADRVPKPLEGRLVEITYEAEQVTVTAEPVRKEKTESARRELVEKNVTASPKHRAIKAIPEGGELSIQSSNLNEQDDLMGELIVENTKETEAEIIGKKRIDSEKETTKSETGSDKQALTETTQTPDDKTVVAEFFDWVWGQVESKEYQINRNSPLFVVEYNETKHLAIMSPLTFANYAVEKGYVESIDSRALLLEAAKIIQKSFHHQKVNVAIAGQQVHKYTKNSSLSAKSPKLNFYLVEINKISNQNLRDKVNGMEYSDSIKRQYGERKP